MPTESTFILASIFILLAATGWVLGYFGERDEQPPLNIDYLKGLNFLLNEQTDQAVEHFLKMVRVDNTTIETHFALGNLFRKRGEVNRAIRIHQNIIARPDILDAQRNQAFYSLAKDYLHAGLLDRAEVLLKRLTDHSQYKMEALESLVNIYEQEQEWQKSIDTSKQLSKISKKPLDLQISHYVCELAEIAIEKYNYDEANNLVSSLNRIKNKTLRCDLVKARIAVSNGNKELAITIYQKIIEENSYLITEALPLMVDIYIGLNKQSELEAKMENIISNNSKITRDIAYTVIVNNIEGIALFDLCVDKYIEMDLTLREFIDINNLNLNENRIVALRKIKKGLSLLANSTPRYQCEECGFSSQRLLWQCPSCKQWETQRPFANVQFDSILQRKPLISD
ncbi:MAG TPA: hypothetical protein QGF04_03460 [Woeseiaceae bacterium]|nr:hypothetical protein [Woeseiaceae bacterium]